MLVFVPPLSQLGYAIACHPVWVPVGGRLRVEAPWLPFVLGAVGSTITMFPGALCGRRAGARRGELHTGDTASRPATTGARR